MKRATIVSTGSAAVLAALLSGCGSGGGIRPPNPQPTPTPTPGPGPSTEFLLKATGRTFTDLAGKAVDLHGFNSCCTSEDPEPSPDWSLWSEGYQAFLEPKYGPNLLVHMRLGPWTPNEWFPAKIQEHGGPYLVQPDGRVDLAQWNPRFWARLEQLLAHGRTKGIRFELDVVDGWACKKRKGFWEDEGIPRYHPWIAENNIQGIDAYGQCGRVEIKVGSSDPVHQVYERWVRKVAEHGFRFDNTMAQDGNEIILVPDYTQAWTASMGNILADEEKRLGYPKHLFGTNAAPTTAGIPQVDYVTIHTSAPMTDVDCNTTTKPCRNNEYNPDPPFAGAQLQMLYCDAKAKGMYWDFWRHSMGLPQARSAWDLMSKPCDGVVSGCTDIPNEGAIEIDKPPSMYTDEVNATHIALLGYTSGPINQPMKSYLLDFAQKFRELHPHLCAGVQTDHHGLVDEVCVGTRDVCQGYHVFNCKAIPNCPDDNPDCGCDSGNARPAPNAAMDAWRRPGAPARGLFSVPLVSPSSEIRRRPVEKSREKPWLKK